MSESDIVVSVVGARPHFIKSFPFVRAMARSNLRLVTIHTGQHYDRNMSALFFEELELSPPDINLNVGSGTHAEQTAAVMVGVEKAVLELKPQAVVVYGDTNSTLGATLAAAKYYFPVVHVEAGVRCANRRMPEEINRILIDHASDYLICPSALALQNLAGEGVTRGVMNQGDFMYDTFLAARKLALSRPVPFEEYGVRAGEYVLSTIHRELSTESSTILVDILSTLDTLGEPVILPLHPRTQARLKDAGFTPGSGGLRIVPPLGYPEMLQLLSYARRVVTDSGGLQKEAYWAGVPCVTMMTETTWPETIEAGWNVLVGTDGAAIRRAVAAETPEGGRPEVYGPPGAAQRMVETLGWV